jgi:3-isopropylmalate dehydrogenase
MLLRYSLQLEAEAQAVEHAVEAVLADGGRTADIAPRGGQYLSTDEFAAAILAKL